MLIDAVKRCLVRDLAGFALELDAYPDDASVWLLPNGVNNSTGTLTLHVCGNLRYFVGAILGRNGYVRDRAAEFAVRGLPRVELEMLLAVTRDEVARALDQLDSDLLPLDYPVPVGKTTLSTGRFLVHLTSHLAYHLGQADVHRRVVTGQTQGVGTVAVPPLGDPTLG
ncbi:MAG TPA: DinB family protein [Gemmatimonadales bacterium]